MNYIFYAAKTVKLKACVTKFLRHICLLSPLPLSAWEIPEPNTRNPVSFGCPFQSFENVIVSLSSGFYFSPLLYVQGSECACWVPPISSLPSFWDADFLWQVQPCPCISDPGSPNSWMEHTCYFLLCKPPPPPCLFMLSIPISDILPLVPSKIFHTSRYFHGNQSRGETKRLRVSFSLVWVMCLHASGQLCGVAFSTCPSDKSHRKATPSPCQEVGNTERSLCWLFSWDSDHKEVVCRLKPEAYLNLSQK